MRLYAAGHVPFKSFIINTSANSGESCFASLPKHGTQTACHPTVPLRPATLGATIGQGARIPGKQVRTPRCLTVVSGHRELLVAVPGHTPLWTGLGLHVVPRYATLTARHT